MLRELHLTNIGLMDRAELVLHPGLNVLTGQTGSGKSMLLAALEAVTGRRSGAELARLLRHTPEGPVAQGRVVAVFELDPSDRDGHRAVEAACGEELEPGEPLLLARRINAEGRSSAYINDRPASAAALRRLGDLLFEVHGQHASHRLNQPAEQLAVLDRLAEHDDLLDAYRQRYRRWVRVREEMARGLREREDRRRRLELLMHHREEIDAVGPMPGEWRRLKERVDRLGRAGERCRLLHEAAAVLGEREDPEPLVTQLERLARRLAAAGSVTSGLGRRDGASAEPGPRSFIEVACESLLDHAAGLGEICGGLVDEAERIEAEAEALAEAERRFDELQRLDYHLGRQAREELTRAGIEPGSEGDAEPDASDVLVAYRDWLTAQIDADRGADDRLDELACDRRLLEGELELMARRLARGRREAAAKLSEAIGPHLRDLAMPDAEVTVVFEPWRACGEESGCAGSAESVEPTASSGETVAEGDGAGVAAALGPQGADRVTWMLRANAGHPPHPLRETASGGELSRVLLAVRSAVSGLNQSSTVIFDEIDANVGSRLGLALAEKIAALSGAGAGDGSGGGPRRQVLCITHLPQVAAAADRHFVVSKQGVGRGRMRTTRTVVEVVSGESRDREITAMMAGQAASRDDRRRAAGVLLAG